MSMEFKHYRRFYWLTGVTKEFCLRGWLEQSRFRTWEALKRLEAWKEYPIYSRNRPDVILVNADSITEDLKLLSECYCTVLRMKRVSRYLLCRRESASRSDNVSRAILLR